MDNDDISIEVDFSVDSSDIEDETSEYTLILYPEDGSAPSIIVADSTTTSISVEEGTYSIIIINGTMDSHTALSFENINSYTTICVNLVDLVNLNINAYTLYSDTIESITLTQGTNLSFTLTDTATTLHLTTYIQNLNLLSESGSYVNISGIASGILLHNREAYCNEPITIYMSLSTVTYNYGSTINGYMRDQTKCFGLYKDAEGYLSNTAYLNFKLLSSSGYYQQAVDITDSINTVDNDDQVLSVEIPNITIN